MFARIILSVIAVLTITGPVRGNPCLIAVDIESQREIRLWQTLQIPTYAFLKNIAIAEIEESELQVLDNSRLSYRVIDRSPWTLTYVICVPEFENMGRLPGLRIWGKDEVSIIKMQPETLPLLNGFNGQFYRIKPIPLSDHFWKQLLAKTVPLKSVDWDPFVQSLVDQVNTDSLTSYIQRLQDFVTREATSDSSYAASQWLFNRFEQMGYPVEFDSFPSYSPNPPYEPGYERNVIARLEGAFGLSRYYIICGHFDSTSEIPGYAPGADDNATGTAATLEAARIMGDHSLDHTIEFICWAAEELATDDGSAHYAEQSVSEGWDIGGVVNMDMIGYKDDSFLDSKVQYRSQRSYPVAQLHQEAAQTYVPELTSVIRYGEGSSDWCVFSYLGYRAVGIQENDGTEFNPNWNLSGDVITTLSPALYTAVAKAAIATIAVLSLSPEQVEDVTVLDIGDGTGVQVSWEASEAIDVIGYTIDWGTASEQYTDSVFVEGISAVADTIEGLMADTTYFFVVRAIDSDGYRSWSANEVMCTPRLAPAKPVHVTATPVPQGIRVDWDRNTELDLAGYRVYRRINEATSYDSLNTDLLTDTTYVDAPLSGANHYYYVVRAEDESGNSGSLSDEAWSRPMTLDQGILIVDETKNLPSYPDDAHDEFYRYIVEGYRYEEIEYTQEFSVPSLSDIAPFSTVLWHAEDYSEFVAHECVEALATYLDAGGNLWFIGWKPTADFMGTTDYPAEFSEGEFVYDYLKINHVDHSTSSDQIQGVLGLLDYPILEVDSDKVPLPAWGGTMRYFEALASLSTADDIYTIDAVEDDSPFEGEVCGVRYLGNDFRTVFFGFPLYFMDIEQARMVAQQVMADFGELDADDQEYESPLAAELKLEWPRPNPFSTRTFITYHTPYTEDLELQIFDIVGHLVRSLVKSPHDAGMHCVEWSGLDDRGLRVANGVYVVRLESGINRDYCKLVVLR